MSIGSVLGVIFTGFVIWLTQGRIDPSSKGKGVFGLYVLLGLWFGLPFLMRKKITQPFTQNILIAVLFLVPVLTTLINDNLLYPNFAAQNKGITFLGPLQTIPSNSYFLFQSFLWLALTVWAVFFVRNYFCPPKNTPRLFGLALLGLISLVLVLVVVPFPYIDVFTSNTSAVVKLLEGQNPYGAQYLDLYGGQAGYQPSFGYLPGYFLAGIPSLIFGDIRYASIAVIVVFVYWLWRCPENDLFSTKQKIAIGACIFFGGSSYYIVEQAWIDPILAGCFLLAGTQIRIGRMLSAGLFLGLATSIKQYGFIGVAAFILYIFASNGKKKGLVISLSTILTFVFIVTPFLIWSPKDFIDSTFLGIKSLPTRIDSLSVRSLIMVQTGKDLLWLSWLVPLSSLFLLVWTKTLPAKRLSDAFVCAGYLYLTIFLFSPHAFANYYYLVYLLFLSGLIFSEFEKSPIREVAPLGKYK